jgi:hypothetical protein
VGTHDENDIRLVQTVEVAGCLKEFLVNRNGNLLRRNMLDVALAPVELLHVRGLDVKALEP